MKAAALALMLANLVVFGWLYTHPQQPGGVIHATPLPATVEPLVLLRERTKAVETERETPSAQKQTEPVIAAAVQEPISGQVDTPQEPAPIPSETTTPVQAPEAAGDGPQLETPASDSMAEAPPAEPALERICQTIGPFPTATQADAFVSKLTAVDREPAIRAARIEQPSGYWVYLPTMPRPEARSIIDDLAAKGVKDYFLGRQNFISLGVFSDKRSAEMRMREITALGYAPRLEPRFLTREVFWVDLEEPASQRLEAARWDDLLKDHPDLRRQSVACE